MSHYERRDGNANRQGRFDSYRATIDGEPALVVYDVAGLQFGWVASTRVVRVEP